MGDESFDMVLSETNPLTGKKGKPKERNCLQLPLHLSFWREHAFRARSLRTVSECTLYRIRPNRLPINWVIFNVEWGLEEYLRFGEVLCLSPQFLLGNKLYTERY